jgi:hypothetical protein
MVYSVLVVMILTVLLGVPSCTTTSIKREPTSKSVLANEAKTMPQHI